MSARLLTTRAAEFSKTPQRSLQRLRPDLFKKIGHSADPALTAIGQHARLALYLIPAASVVRGISTSPAPMGDQP